MLEIEAKYRPGDIAIAEAALVAVGAAFRIERMEADHYFNGPDRDYRTTDEAFRLRRIGEENLLTHKGPRLNATIKTRPEIEFALGSGEETAENCVKMLIILGFRPVAVVRKRRRIYDWTCEGTSLHISLDFVESVGDFIEIEALTDEAGLPQAEKAIRAAANALDLSLIERRSYLTMLLQHLAR